MSHTASEAGQQLWGDVRLGSLVVYQPDRFHHHPGVEPIVGEARQSWRPGLFFSFFSFSQGQISRMLAKFRNFWRARSRLHPHRSLQVRLHYSAFSRSPKSSCHFGSSSSVATRLAAAASPDSEIQRRWSRFGQAARALR